MIPFCISRSSVVPSRRVGFFLEFSVNFRLFTGQILIWSSFILLLSMTTSSYRPIASGTYNRWKVEFVLKTKMTKTSVQRRLWWNCIQRGLVVSIFIHSRSLVFEGNASLWCVYSGLTPLSTSRRCLVATGSSVRLGGSQFYTYNSGFPFAFICLSSMLMAVDFSRRQKSYSVHVFNLYYIVIDLEAGQCFIGRFQNLDYMHFQFVHFTGGVFGFNLGAVAKKCYMSFNSLTIEQSLTQAGFTLHLLWKTWHQIERDIILCTISSVWHHDIFVQSNKWWPG